MKRFKVKGSENPLHALFKPLPEYKLDRFNTALLIIDMQYLDAHPEYGIFKEAKKKGLPEEAYRYYKERLELIVPNIRRLMDAFRARAMEVVHTKIESMTPDGRDRSLQHKCLGLEAKPGSFEARILDELAPLEGEAVLCKTASGAFSSTNLDYILRNLGINQLVVTGVMTNHCVETTVRVASDLSYEVILAEDGCGAMTEEIHMACIVNSLRDGYAKIRTTDQILQELDEHISVRK